MLEISCKSCDITPEIPCFMGGYIERDHPFESVHDPIEASVMALRVQGKTVLLITMDVSGTDVDFNEELIALIKKQTAVDENAVIIAGLHTHSGPLLADRPYSAYHADPAYRSLVLQRVSNCAASVLKEPFLSVRAMYRNVVIDGLYSNRNMKQKDGDKHCHLIEFYNEHQRVAAFFTISCHSTVLGPNNYALSADLTGAIRRLLQERLSACTLVTQGSSGDMGNRQYRQGNDFHELQRLSNAIVEQVFAHTETKELACDDIKIVNVHHPLDFRMSHDGLREKQADFGKRLLTETDFDRIKLLKAGIGGCKRKLAMDQVHIDMDAKILSLGDLEIIAVPGELASELGMRIQASSTAECCLIVGYANGSIGYIVEAEAYQFESQESNSSAIPQHEPEKYVEAIIEKLVD